MPAAKPQRRDPRAGTADLRSASSPVGFSEQPLLPPRVACRPAVRTQRAEHGVRRMHAFYRASGPEELRVLGETEFVNGVAAMAASGRYGSVLACEGIVWRADLLLGEAVGPVLDAHIHAGNGRFSGIRHAGAWDASPDIRGSTPIRPRACTACRHFAQGLKELAKRSLSFEAWQYHPQLPDVIALARAVPEAKIVLDHVGGPVGLGPSRAAATRSSRPGRPASRNSRPARMCS